MRRSTRAACDAVLALMHPDVDWPNAMEGGREQRSRGRSAPTGRGSSRIVRSDVEPELVETEADGRVAVRVHQVVANLCGEPVSDGHVRQVYTLRDGLIERMDVDAA